MHVWDRIILVIHCFKFRTSFFAIHRSTTSKIFEAVIRRTGTKLTIEKIRKLKAIVYQCFRGILLKPALFGEVKWRPPTIRRTIFTGINIPDEILIFIDALCGIGEFDEVENVG